MKCYDEISKLYTEEVNQNVVLDRHTSDKKVFNATTLVVYHACSFKGDFLSRIKSRPDKNVHAGSYFQAVWRADMKINDPPVEGGGYDTAYIYELVLNPKRICKNLIHDAGYNVDQKEEDQYKPEYDLLVYHNTGEGHATEPNLSVIILDHSIIKSAKLHSVMNGEQASSYIENN